MKAAAIVALALFICWSDTALTQDSCKQCRDFQGPV